jgi:hypothetical protein
MENLKRQLDAIRKINKSKQDDYVQANPTPEEVTPDEQSAVNLDLLTTPGHGMLNTPEIPYAPEEDIAPVEAPLDQEDISPIPTEEPLDQEDISPIPSETPLGQENIAVSPQVQPSPSVPSVGVPPTEEQPKELTKAEIYQNMFDKYKVYKDKLRQQADEKRNMAALATLGTGLAQAGATMSAGAIGQKANRLADPGDDLIKQANALDAEILDIDKLEISMDAKQKLEGLKKQGFDIRHDQKTGAIYAISKSQVDADGKPVIKTLKAPQKVDSGITDHQRKMEDLSLQTAQARLELMKANVGKAKSYAKYKDFQISEDTEKDRTTIQKEVKKHPLWKKAQDYKAEITGLDELLEQAKTGGKNGATALKLAKAFGEKGALSESDVTRYISSAGVLNFVKSKASEWSNGKLSDGAYMSVKNIIDNVKKAQMDNLNTSYHESAIDFKRSRKTPMSYAEARYYVDPRYRDPKTISERDQQALDWVINNPNAKQTPGIMKKLQEQGLL